MTENNNLGNKYRLIRKGKNINLQVAADRITSVSHLSEWENGKASMDADMLLRLLNRINIEPYDFLIRMVLLRFIFTQMIYAVICKQRY